MLKNADFRLKMGIKKQYKKIKDGYFAIKSNVYVKY